MALDALELASIGAIILVFFLWGPDKIPQLARLVAQARREFDNATKEFQKVSTSIADGTSPFFASSAAPETVGTPAAQAAAARPALPQLAAAPSGKTGDQLLIEAARKLGIQTTGKTREQIQEEIIAMAQRPSVPATSPTPPPGGDSAP